MDGAPWHRGNALALFAWLWAGLLLGVSFVATPVKFLAPSLSQAHALEVGRVTFTALQWIEFAAVAAMAALFALLRPGRVPAAIFGLVVALIAGQYFGLLPILDARAETIIRGVEVPASSLHWLYPVLEFVKVGLLVALGAAARTVRA